MTAPSDLAPLLGELVTAFVAAHPRVSVEVSFTNRMVNLVTEGFDVALRAGVVRDPSLIAKRVIAMTARLFASPSYLARRGIPATIEDLATHDLVLFRPKDLVGNWELVSEDGAERIEVRGRIATDDFGLVHAAAVAGAGIGLMPAIHAAEDV